MTFSLSKSSESLKNDFETFKRFCKNKSFGSENSKISLYWNEIEAKNLLMSCIEFTRSIVSVFIVLNRIS